MRLRFTVRPCPTNIAISVVLLSLLVPAFPAQAGRCATGLRGDNPNRFVPLRPAFRSSAARVVAPVPTSGAHVYPTEHFRVLWGDGYDHRDPDWADPDGDGVPTWIEVLADALESAYSTQTALGFPEPYGVDRYYLDAYVGNTGVVADGQKISISQGYYAYTDIDLDYEVAYFIFNDDFSAYATDELAVLRATAAHELFHAVQRVDYPWDDDVLIPEERWEREGWWFEASSTWMEEVCEPNVNDYVTYVREFLSRPEASLSSTDGLREYGASIFAGFLWLRHGGAPFWRSVFQDAYVQGLELAMGNSLSARGDPGLGEVVASFWACTGHPEDFWPDGALYRGPDSPRIFRSAAYLPLEVNTSSATGPDRFGANLFEIPTSELPADLALLSAAQGSTWSASVSTEGSVAIPSAASLSAGGTAVIPETDGTGMSYLAVTNTSSGFGRREYTIRLDRAAEIGPPPEDEGAGAGDPGLATDPVPDSGSAGTGEEKNDGNPDVATNPIGGSAVGDTEDVTEPPAGSVPSASGGGSSGGCFLQVLGPG